MKKHFLKKGVYLNDFEATWIKARLNVHIQKQAFVPGL